MSRRVVVTDSGVGSASDHRSHSSRSSPGGFEGQWNSLPDLQEAYRDLFADKEHYKHKARKLDDELVAARKAFKELEAQWRGLLERNNQLEEEKARLVKDRKAMADRADELKAINASLADQVAGLSERLDKKRSSSRSPTSAMSGANPEAKPPRRNPSKRETSSKEEKRRSREPEAKSSKVGSRRNSYYEPWGEAGPSASAAASSVGGSGVQFANYKQSSYGEPVVGTTQAAAYSDVPRTAYPVYPPPISQSIRPDTAYPVYPPPISQSIRPEVHYIPPAGLASPFLESGDYQHYPLPNKGHGHKKKSSK